MTAFVLMRDNYISGEEYSRISELQPIKEYLSDIIKDKLVIVGKSYFQLIDREMLKDNRVIVLTHDKSLSLPKNAKALTIEELDNSIHDILWQNVIVIGGLSVFLQLISSCDRIYIAYIDPKGEFDTPCNYENPIIDDSYFLSSVEKIKQYEDISYRFFMYSKRRKNIALFNMITELLQKLCIEERTRQYAKENAERYIKENPQEAEKSNFYINKIELTDFDISYHTGVRYGDHLCGSIEIYCENKYKFTYEVLFDAVNGEVIDDFFYSN